MNIDTGEVRDLQDLSAAEKNSGAWLPLRGKWAKKYHQKTPVSAADRSRILKAESKRLRRRASLLEQIAGRVNE